MWWVSCLFMQKPVLCISLGPQTWFSCTHNWTVAVLQAIRSERMDDDLRGTSFGTELLEHIGKAESE